MVGKFNCTYLAVVWCLVPAFARAESDVQQLTRWLLEEDRRLEGLPFSEVIEAATGRRVLPIDRSDAATRRVLQLVAQAADLTLREANQPDAEAGRTRRINEASRFFEDTLRARLEAEPSLSCDFPPTAEGKAQRSGYPDLRLVDQETGTVYYIDPKVHATDSRRSSFRTFYYEPKTTTNKVLEDAHHLVLGISHATVEGRPPHFQNWELIDLTSMKIKLKAEFESSNREMYRDDAVVAAGGEPR